MINSISQRKKLFYDYKGGSLRDENNHKMAFQSRLEVETKGKVDVIIFSSRRGFLILVMCANQYYENMMEIGLNYHSPNPLSLNTNYIFIASSQPFYQS